MRGFCVRTSRTRWALVTMLALLGSAVMPVRAQTLGRLFSSPEVRAALERMREVQQHADPTTAAGVHARGRPALVPHLTVNGIVLRRDGRDAAWVNGNIIASGGVTPDGVRVEATRGNDRGVRISLPGRTRIIHLKPGQKLDVQKWRVFDAHEAGAREAESAAGADAIREDSRAPE